MKILSSCNLPSPPFRISALVGVLAIFATSPIADAAERPNIVLMIADDCTYLDMEVYGGQAKTPNLNKLAKEGLTFNRCFQTAPMCSPTRHNIYTGLYPVRSGAWPNHTRVYPGTKSIVHYLGDSGYRVALSGKGHISPKESFPFEYSNDFSKNEPETRPFFPNLKKFIAQCRSSETPFCLVACSNEPHSPYTMGDASAYPPESLKLPPSWVDTPATRASYSKYLAEITYYDWQCGALLSLLDDFGLRDNTLVIVVSEQGSAFPFAKWTCFEMGLASGMIARWPGKVKAGTSTNALVEYVDLLPTFVEAAGATPKDLDGKSFLPVLLGDASEHKKYTYGLQTTRGIINGSDAYGIRSCGNARYRYIRNLHPEATFTNAVTRKGGDGKANFWVSWQDKAEKGDPHARAMVKKYQRRPAEELYDVEKDPHCLVNLIEDTALAGVRKELSTQLDGWMKSQGDKGAATEEIAHTRKANFNRSKKRKKN